MKHIIAASLIGLLGLVSFGQKVKKENHQNALNQEKLVKNHVNAEDKLLI